MSVSKCMWKHSYSISSRGYICYFCNERVASDKGYEGTIDGYNISRYVRICPHCTQPTLFTYSVRTGVWIQVPKPLPLSPITDAKDDVKDLFEEARKCMSTESYTAVAMICRKLLMNIAVDHGAEENQKFKVYVEYIQSENLVSKSATELLTEIKDIGNDANHEIPQVSVEKANQIIELTNEVIRQIYKVKTLSLKSRKEK